MPRLKSTDKDNLTFDDSDGKLHLYTSVAFNGKRWALQVVFREEQITRKDFEHQGMLLISSAIRTLQREKIISV